MVLENNFFRGQKSKKLKTFYYRPCRCKGELKGEKGERGDRGEIGEKGEVGEVGDTGPHCNIKGPKGETGDMGPQGIRGDMGEVGIRGETGPIGDAGDVGASGDDGPPGDVGPPGDEGPFGETGETGEYGLKGLEGDSIGEIGMKKILRFFQEANIPCSIEVTTEPLNTVSPLSGISSRELIEKIELSCVYFVNQEIVPISSIETISCAFKTSAERLEVSNEIKNILMESLNCNKNLPNNVTLNSLGEVNLTGDVTIDYEYSVVCNMVNSRESDAITIENGGTLIDECICKAFKIPMFTFDSKNSNQVGRAIESVARDSTISTKDIKLIKTLKGDFVDLSNVLGNISYVTCALGNMIVNYITNGDQHTFVLSIINIDKISYIEII